MNEQTHAASSESRIMAFRNLGISGADDHDRWKRLAEAMVARSLDVATPRLLDSLINTFAGTLAVLIVIYIIVFIISSKLCEVQEYLRVQK